MEKKIIKQGNFLTPRWQHSSAMLIAFIGGAFAAMLFFCGELSKQGLSISLLFYFIIGICGILHQSLSARKRFCGSFTVKLDKDLLYNYEVKIKFPHNYHSHFMQFSIGLLHSNGDMTKIEKKFFNGWDKNQIYANASTLTPVIRIIFFDENNHRSEGFSLLQS